jgi:2-hydroxycyclohexanecarboxyl-CoA dehydrogenase
VTRFEDTTALVTGGASGIGAATVRRLADEGAFVVVADIDEEGAGKVAAEVGGVALVLDVADVPGVRGSITAVQADVGPIHVLVNNAGTDRMAFFLDTDEADWTRVLGINLVGTMACTHAVLPGMQERRSGAIVNVASEAGRVGAVGGAAYAASKGGVIAFTKAIARESARYGIRCNVATPGPIDTPLLQDAAEQAGSRGAAVRQGMIDATTIGRLGSPEEVAAGIAFLASDDASFITGHALAISGGLSMC